MQLATDPLAALSPRHCSDLPCMSGRLSKMVLPMYRATFKVLSPVIQLLTKCQFNFRKKKSNQIRRYKVSSSVPKHNSFVQRKYPRSSSYSLHKLRFRCPEGNQCVILSGTMLFFVLSKTFAQDSHYLSLPTSKYIFLFQSGTFFRHFILQSLFSASVSERKKIKMNLASQKIFKNHFCQVIN